MKPAKQPPPPPSQGPPQHKLPTGNPWLTLGPVLAPETMQVITKEFNFTHLTAVQSATIPAFLSNKDVSVQAVTGSGKTLAFVVPMIEILTALPTPLQRHHIGAMIITPTRELAQQIHAIVSKFTEKVPLAGDPRTFLCPPALCIGGKNPEQELASLQKHGVNIMIGTPGRLDQVLNTKFVIDPSKLEILILDEADRLLEQGFSQNLSSIMKRLPKQRRTGLFSATLTTQIQELARMGLRNPVNITLKVHYKDQKINSKDNNDKVYNDETLHTARYDPNNPYLSLDPAEEKEKKQQVEQDRQLSESQHQAIPSSLTNYYQIVQPEHKILHLVNFLMQHSDKNIIVFFLTCAEVDYFYRVLSTFPPLTSLYTAFNHEMIETVGLQHVAASSLNASKSDKKADKNIPKALFCALHGQMNQSKRTRTLDAFKQHTNTYNSETYPTSSLSAICTTIPTASNTRIKPAQPVATSKQTSADQNTAITQSTPTQMHKRRLGSVLLCTDVASRGVDVSNIDWVLQIDPPQQPDTFIHRIGRSARAGQRGMALTWLLESERSFVELMKNKHVPFFDYIPLQITLNQQLLNKLAPVKLPTPGNVMGPLSNKGAKNAVKLDPVYLPEHQQFDLGAVEKQWDEVCWAACEETYFTKSNPSSTSTNAPSSGDNNVKDKNANQKDANNQDKLVHLDVPSSGQDSTALTNIPPLPNQLEFKEIIPYNTYKVLVDKKDNRRGFKEETKKQSQQEHVALKKQQTVQSNQSKQSELLPPFTQVVLTYPKIDPLTETHLLNPNLLSTQIVSKFIAHTRYCVSYDKYLFDLCQKSYVSHINGYKEHAAKFIFPFDRLLFVHVAVGYGLLYLPQLADLKKYALIWPQFTRLVAKSITTYHNTQIEDIKVAESELKRERQLKAIEKRQQQEKEKRKEREFNEKQREKKRKNRTKITYEEVRKEWEDLGDELKEMRKKTRTSGKKSIFD